MDAALQSAPDARRVGVTAAATLPVLRARLASDVDRAAAGPDVIGASVPRTAPDQLDDVSDDGGSLLASARPRRRDGTAAPTRPRRQRGHAARSAVAFLESR